MNLRFAGAVGRAALLAALCTSAALAGTATSQAQATERSAGPQAASDQAWRRLRVSFAASGVELRTLLQDLAAAAGVRAAIAPEISGSASHQADDDPLETVLTDLGRRYGFEWWHDGRALAITPAAANASRLFRLREVTADELESALRTLGLYEPRFAPRMTDAGLAFLSGPPAYVAAVELVLEDLEAAAAEPPPARGVEAVRWGRPTRRDVPRGPEETRMEERR